MIFFVKIAIALLVTLSFYGGLISITRTQTTQKIVHRKESVSQQVKDHFISGRESYEVAMPMNNSLIKQQFPVNPENASIPAIA